MSGMHDSTDAIIREHVKPLIENEVAKQLEVFDKAHKERSMRLHKDTMERLEELSKCQEVVHQTILGTMPPDINKPAMWTSLSDLLKWKKNINKFIWLIGGALIGLTVKAFWASIQG